MAFRRDHGETKRWKLWLDRNRDALRTQCGLPAFIVSDRQRWQLFVQEGHDWESGFDCEMLDPEQADALLDLLVSEHGEAGLVSSDLAAALRSRRK